jgi:hypothetical protein
MLVRLNRKAAHGGAATRLSPADAGGPATRAAHRRAGARAGITLLEVVISMGVLAVGVMSIASLLPVGRYQLSQASALDHAAAVGRAACRDMQVHGYMRPGAWLYVDSTLRPVTIGAVMTAPPGASRDPQTNLPSNIVGFQQTPPAMPLVLDPLLVSMNVAVPGVQNFTGANTQTQTAVSTFPYFLRNGGFSGNVPEASAPKIPRITLRDVSLLPGPAKVTTNIRCIPMGVADRLFRSTDDVAFNVVAANSTLAAQNLAPTTQIQFVTRSGAYIARAARGDYSFFAVLSPDFSETWGAPGGYPGSPATVMFQGSAATNRLFNLAVVVCYQRELRTLSNFTPNTAYDRGERMAWVDFVGRGEVRLRAMGLQQQGQAQQLLDVKPNQWIMVCGQIGGNKPTQNYMPVPPMFAGKSWVQTVAKFYRILSVSTQAVQDPSGQSAWYRSARVSGPDWTINGICDGNPQNMIYDDANAFTYSDLGNSLMPDPPTGFGTIVNGAIAVYEKTVNLDDSSAFSY